MRLLLKFQLKSFGNFTRYGFILLNKKYHTLYNQQMELLPNNLVLAFLHFDYRKFNMLIHENLQDMVGLYSSYHPFQE